ncbi:hypothetical protein QQ045_020125 [Rhodiola kirilowii]
MNPNNSSSSNPNSQDPNTQFPYPFLNPYFPYSQNTSHPNPNSQVSSAQFSSPQNSNFNFQAPNPQFSFPNPFIPYAQNSQYQYPFVPNFQSLPSRFGTQQTPTNYPNSPQSQIPTFGGTNIIDLNDDHEEHEDTREVHGQWTWSEDHLLISAWLNVSTDPMIGTDQKGETFWERIHQYCEESIPGLIKRGVIAMKRRWQRINEGAQRYGSCYDQAERRIGSGTNMDNIIQLAHELHVAKYKKKSNFDKHWNELRKQPKWRNPSAISEGSKRSKLSDSGAYSSSANNETPTDENVVESPVRPKGTKAAKRKGKGKVNKASEEMEILKSAACRKLSLMDDFVKIQQRKEERKTKEQDLKIIQMDTSAMNDTQREIHAKLLQEIYSRRM